MTDGSLMYERVLSRAELEARRAEPAPAQPLKRRAYDDLNGLDSQYIPTTSYVLFLYFAIHIFIEFVYILFLGKSVNMTTAPNFELYY